jgi:hypothetical protein
MWPIFKFMCAADLSICLQHQRFNVGFSYRTVAAFFQDAYIVVLSNLNIPCLNAFTNPVRQIYQVIIYDWSTHNFAQSLCGQVHVNKLILCIVELGHVKFIGLSDLDSCGTLFKT